MRAARASLLSLGMAALLLAPAASATLEVEPSSFDPTLKPGEEWTGRFVVRMTNEELQRVQVVRDDRHPEIKAFAEDDEGLFERLMGGTEGTDEWALGLHVEAAAGAQPGKFSFAMAIQSQSAESEEGSRWATRELFWVDGTIEPPVEPLVDDPRPFWWEGLAPNAVGVAVAAAIAVVALLVVRSVLNARRARRSRRRSQASGERWQEPPGKAAAVEWQGVAAQEAAPAERREAWIKLDSPDFAPDDVRETEAAAEPEPPRRDWARGRPPAPNGHPRAAAAGAAPGAAALPATARAEPPTRYVNVLLKDADGRDVEPARPLAPDATHRLLVGIGPPDEASIVEEPRRFPGDRLPRRAAGHALDVVLVGEGVELDGRRRRYFLPPSGPGWACTCGSDGDVCRCEDEDRAPIALDWRTPGQPGRVGIRVAVYYGRNLVQSLLVDAQVGGRKPKGRPAVAARVDYVLSHDLGDLALLPARAVNILHNDAPDGSHTVVVNGEMEEPLVFTWSDLEVDTAIKAARKSLFAVHAKGDLAHRGQWASLLGDGNEKPTGEFIDDLRRLAVAGTILLRDMVKRKEAEMAALMALLDRTDQPIQVSRTGASTLYFPWALVYQLENDEQRDAFRPCRMLREWDAWRGKPLPVRCKYGDDQEHRGENCLCPYGFWGLRHLLEHQPSVPAGKVRDRIKAAATPARLAVGACSTLKQAGAHKAELRGRLGRMQVLWEEPRSKVLALAATPGLEVLYFYCHGDLVDKEGFPTPSMLVGDDEAIDGGLIRKLKKSWRAQDAVTTGPLVFINGCETVAMTVRQLGSVIDDLVQAGACGVIGTEVPLLEPMAREAGVEFLLAFQDVPAAQAIRQMRLRLLSKGNLMGLAYTPYCNAGLRLEHAP